MAIEIDEFVLLFYRCFTKHYNLSYAQEKRHHRVSAYLNSSVGVTSCSIHFLTEK